MTWWNCLPPSRSFPAASAMSKVLEALVARGRRVRRAREQREVAFGLADLSTKRPLARGAGPPLPAAVACGTPLAAPCCGGKEVFFGVDRGSAAAGSGVSVDV